VTAAYFGMNGDRIFEIGKGFSFERDFLRYDNMGELKWRAFATIPRWLLGPGTRLDIVSDYFDDVLFHKAKFDRLNTALSKSACFRCIERVGYQCRRCFSFRSKQLSTISVRILPHSDCQRPVVSFPLRFLSCFLHSHCRIIVWHHLGQILIRALERPLLWSPRI